MSRGEPKDRKQVQNASHKIWHVVQRVLLPLLAAPGPPVVSFRPVISVFNLFCLCNMSNRTTAATTCAGSSSCCGRRSPRRWRTGTASWPRWGRSMTPRMSRARPRLTRRSQPGPERLWKRESQPRPERPQRLPRLLDARADGRVSAVVRAYPEHSVDVG